MKKNMEYKEARELLLSLVKIKDTERVDLNIAGGRILAEDLIAAENVPAFEKSPYDGYAFMAEDSENASEKNPVTLKIIEEIPAGKFPEKEITKGYAAKILTGAPIPKGADAVIMFEKTTFTPDTVTLYGPCESGDNIIKIGEDVKKGEVLAEKGVVIDPGLAATLASQGQGKPMVYKIPKISIISTGSELVDADEEVPEGKIRNSNRYSFAAALAKDGVETEYLGTAKDNAEDISRFIERGLEKSDFILLTGGVSVGDYDLTPEAMEKAGCELLVKGVGIKPGMACCFAVKDSKLVIGLSGNPSSSLTNYYGVVRPAVKKMTGLRDHIPEEFTLVLAEGFKKKSKETRFIKGMMKIEKGRAFMHLPKGQGNINMGSSIGCNVMAVIPKGSGPLEAGTEITGFMI